MSRSVADTLRGQHLVVTGTTGFVGTVWLSLVLTHAPDIGRLTLLVRGRRHQTAAQRVAHAIDTSPAFRPLRARHAGADLAAWLDDRLEVLDADVTRPDLGLDDATWDRLAASADAVVHIAGLTDFHPDPAKGVPANVDGAVHLGRLAAALRTPRMLHVSTAYVAGRNDGPTPAALPRGLSPAGLRFDPEATWRDLSAIAARPTDARDRTDAAGVLAERLGWPNNYTLTKGLAEHLLASMDLDLCIVRPSVVECARTFPFPGWNEGLNTSGPIMAFCGTAFRALPSGADHLFDIIPVDAVARWMTVALADLLRGEHAPVHHLASSDVNPVPFRRIVELTALGKRRHASRADATTWERLEAHLDVVPRHRDDLPWLTPQRVARVADRLDAGLQRLLRHDATPSGLVTPLRRVRREVTRTRRDMDRLHRMLDVYQPFIHDHSWVFDTASIRAACAALDADDPFYDDVSDLCWRDYWLNVQYPGIVRWAFPLLRGEPVPRDPPSSPPLALPEPQPELSRGVA